MPKTKVRLHICGTDYIITADDNEQYVRSIGAEVERRMQEVMEGNPRISLTMAAILTALSCCDDCTKATDSADNLRAQLKDYLTESARFRSENDEYRRENDRLKKEIADLKSKYEKAPAAKPVPAHQAPVTTQPLRPASSNVPAHSAQHRLAPELAPGQKRELSPEEFLSLLDTEKDEL